MNTRRLWDAATIASVNLIDLGLVDEVFNKNITQVALSTFHNYLNISSLANTRRGRKGSTRTSDPTTVHSTKPTPNDFFFEYQRINGYTRGVQSLKENIHVGTLNSLIFKQSHEYLQLLGGERASQVISLMEDGILSFDIWAAVQQGADAYHKDHVHENVLLSGVYYAAVPDGSAPLILHKPQHSKSEIGDSDVHVITPVEGQTIIFPPWLLHGVPMPKNPPTSPRVSFAFNLSGPFIDPWEVTCL